jgi:Ion channel
VTLTTVGYGDVTARSNLGHTIAVTEALIGQIYLVTVVALLVANLGLRRTGST